MKLLLHIPLIFFLNNNKVLFLFSDYIDDHLIVCINVKTRIKDKPVS